MSARKIGPLKISVDYDHTDECYVGHVEADERTEACDDRDAAEAAAEAKLRETYDALREHFDPVPVLRWTLECNGCLSEGLFICEENSPLRAWRLAAMHYGHDVSFRGNGRNGRAEVDTIEANQRAAEAALRALGVSFRVEGA